MKEAVFILLVIAVLLGLTALRYRKQIAGVIGLARALKDARDMSAQSGDASSAAKVQLINCSKCGVWVPEQKALQVRGQPVCDACVR